MGGIADHCQDVTELIQRGKLPDALDRMLSVEHRCAKATIMSSELRRDIASCSRFDRDVRDAERDLFKITFEAQRRCGSRQVSNANDERGPSTPDPIRNTQVTAFTPPRNAVVSTYDGGEATAVLVSAHESMRILSGRFRVQISDSDTPPDNVHPVVAARRRRRKIASFATLRAYKAKMKLQRMQTLTATPFNLWRGPFRALAMVSDRAQASQ